MGLKKLIPVLLLIFISSAALGQRDSIPLNTFVSKTEKLANEHPFEKVYLHFDKPYYAIGDTIWFKAYLTVGPKHEVSRLSTIVYVDVLNSRDSLVQSLKLPVVSGITYGDVALTRILYKQGNYHIRAYTNWMRNFGPDYFFKKLITVGNATENMVSPKISFTKSAKNNSQVINASLIYKDRDGNLFPEKKISWMVVNGDETIYKGKGTTNKNGLLNLNFAADKLNPADAASLVAVIDLGNRQVTNTFPLKAVFATADVQFFPEGGELIAGVRSKVAFKAINADGFGVDISGSVTDNAGNEVADLTTAHQGMGIFALLPEDGKTYKATVTFPDGSKSSYELPRVRSGGINLAINNNDPDNLKIKVATNAAFFKEYQNKGFYIVAQSGGTIYYTGLASLQSLVYAAVVPKGRFPTGILQLTLFAANGEPQSERVVFIQHNDALNLSFSGNLPSYNHLQHVSLAFSAKSATLPVQGSFSVAVVDETKVPYNEDGETTILSSILLTSDLRGYIEKPNYYFNQPDDKKLADLDILMLTQGYRRFSYGDILADKYPSSTYWVEQDMQVTGTVRTSTGLPVYKANVNLLLPDRNYAKNTLTDAEGHFKFPNVAIYDSSKVVLTAKTATGNADLMIVADAPGYQKVSPGYYNPEEGSSIDSLLSAYLLNSKKQNESSHQLREVVIKGSRGTKVAHISYPALTGLSMDADQLLGADKLTDCGGDFEGCVLGRIFGLWHRDNFYYIKKDYDKGNLKPVKFFLNGLAIEDTYLTVLNPADIESIEVYFKDGVAGVMHFYDCNGIISITTKSHGFSQQEQTKVTGDLSFLLSQSNSVTITPKGFYRTRVFYSPKYTTVQPSIDFRSTIYWNPNIVTAKDGSAAFDYYNATGTGTYKVVIEGIDGDGNIGRAVLRYIVK